MSVLDKFSKSKGRVKSTLGRKFNRRGLEDGATSLRGIRQYRSMAEIYLAFGETLPKDEEDARQDFLSRSEQFQKEKASGH